MEKHKVLLFWSGGTKCNLTLSMIKNAPNLEIIGLISIINPKSNRVNFHGIPEPLLVEQAKLLNLPLVRVFIPDELSVEEYEKILIEKLLLFLKNGVNTFAFGNCSQHSHHILNEYQAYNLNAKFIYPLKNFSTEELVKEYFKNNHQAIISSVDRNKLDSSFLAKRYDQEWITRLPSGVSTFGEKNEYHSFATFSPFFRMRIPYSKTIAKEEGIYTVSLLKEP